MRRGFNARARAAPNPRRARAPGRKFSTRTSAERDQVGEERGAVVGLQVDGDALLVAVDPEVVRAPAVDKRRPVARVVAVIGILDLDHLSPHVAKEHRAERSGQHPRQIDDPEAAERQLTGRVFFYHTSTSLPPLGVTTEAGTRR